MSQSSLTTKAALRARADKLKPENVKHHTSTKVASLTPKYGWSDNTIKELSEKLAWPDVTKDNVIIKDILRRYWSFYIEGTIPTDCSVHSVIFSALLCGISKTTDTTVNYMFKSLTDSKRGRKENEHFFKIGPFDAKPPTMNLSFKALLQPRQKLYQDIRPKAVAPDELLSQDPAFGGMTPIQLEDQFHDYPADKSRRFSEFINRAFNDWVEDKELPAIAIELLKLTTVTTLLSMRATVKSETVLENAFFRKKLIGNMTNVIGTLNTTPFAPPCKTFISNYNLHL